MMDLFKGIAVVIDDEIEQDNANIKKILERIEESNIPVMKYNDIPEDEIIDNFVNVSFVLLDWKLTPNEASDSGVKIPDDVDASKNISFIKKLKEVCYCPIFIFSNSSIDDIERTLLRENLYQENKPNHIFLKEKSELTKKRDFTREISNWIKGTPSIYILKKWESNYQKCKNQLFIEFHKMSPHWPKILWTCYGEDGENQSDAISDLIHKNMYTRMRPIKLNKKILDCNEPITSVNEELKTVLEGITYLSTEYIAPNSIGTGDIYKRGNRYMLNIRAQCDLLRDKDPELYCIEGEVLTRDDKGRYSNRHYKKGRYAQHSKNPVVFYEKINESIVAFIDGGKIVRFDHSLFRIMRKSELRKSKNKHIGRLLPPYINKIQQRYALYMHRQGLPTIPQEVLL